MKIPIFTTQLEKSRDAVSIANIRAAYAEASSEYLTSTNNGTGNTINKTVALKGKIADNFSGLSAELPFDSDGITALNAVDGTASVNLHFTWTAAGALTVTVN